VVSVPLGRVAVPTIAYKVSTAHPTFAFENSWFSLDGKYIQNIGLGTVFQVFSQGAGVVCRGWLVEQSH